MRDTRFNYYQPKKQLKSFCFHRSNYKAGWYIQVVGQCSHVVVVAVPRFSPGHQTQPWVLPAPVSSSCRLYSYCAACSRIAWTVRTSLNNSQDFFKGEWKLSVNMYSKTTWFLKLTLEDNIQNIRSFNHILILWSGKDFNTTVRYNAREMFSETTFLIQNNKVWDSFKHYLEICNSSICCWQKSITASFAKICPNNRSVPPLLSEPLHLLKLV